MQQQAETTKCFRQLGGVQQILLCKLTAQEHTCITKLQHAQPEQQEAAKRLHAVECQWTATKAACTWDNCSISQGTSLTNLNVPVPAVRNVSVPTICKYTFVSKFAAGSLVQCSNNLQVPRSHYNARCHSVDISPAVPIWGSLIANPKPDPAGLSGGSAPRPRRREQSASHGLQNSRELA